MGKFPLYRQHDQMDCGPTCLQMVAKHYGRNYPLHKLRSQSYITREGVSLLGISEAAESIGFRTLGVKIPFETFKAEAPLPCIVHWNQNHFAVVHTIRRNKIQVADPAGGRITYTNEEFKKSWLSSADNGQQTGVALLLEPSPDFYGREIEKEAANEKSISRLFKYLRSYNRLIIQLFVGLLLGSIIQLIVPFLTQSIVDVGINTRNVNFIYLILAGQLMLFFSRMAVDFIRRWILLHLSTRINIANLAQVFRMRVSMCETCAFLCIKSSDLRILAQHEPQVQNPRSKPFILCNIYCYSMA